jgi:hypothetical protein
MKVLARIYIYCYTCILASGKHCVWVINKPCVREAEYMHLIPWTRHHGSEHYITEYDDDCYTVYFVTGYGVMCSREQFASGP